MRLVLRNLNRLFCHGAVAVVLVGAFPVSALAQRWTYASSDHFEVYTTGGDGRARSALTYFERVHSFFEDFLQLAPEQTHPTRLIVFSNDREFRPYRFNEVATAYYLPGPDRDYIVMRSLDADSYPLVVHEYAHLLMRHSGVNYPRWLNEGLAEFFSTLSPQAGQMSLGRVPMGRLMELRQGGRMLDLPRLFAVDHSSAEYNSRTHAGMFYAQSWALTHMLMTVDGYRQHMGRFMAAVSDGQSSAEAIEAVFGRPIADVFSHLLAHVQSSRFGFFSAKYRDPRPESSFPARTVEAFEIGLVTANLLADAPGRVDEARAAYDALLADRPADADVLGARGYFELRRGDRVAAADYLARAVEAGSENAQTYRWAAMFASSDDARETLLARAVQLDPFDVDLRLAYVGVLINRRKPEAALEALAPATRITPEQAFAYFERKALIALQLDEVAEAQKAAASARQYASPGPEAEAAARLVQSIDEFVARQAEVDRMMRATAADAGALPTAPGVGVPPGERSPDPPAAPGAGMLAMATGRFRNLDCSGPAPVLEVATETGTLRLVIDNPALIRLEGADGPTTDLHCGAQERSVQVGYLPNANPSQKTAGQVRVIRFR